MLHGLTRSAFRRLAQAAPADATLLPDDLEVVRYFKFESHQILELFHIRTGGIDYLLQYSQSSGWSYDVLFQGDEAAVAQEFDLALENWLEGAKWGPEGIKDSTEEMDDSAWKHLQLFFHDIFGIDLSTAPEAEADEEVRLARDFNELLGRYIHDWQGGSFLIPLVRHAYWPIFKGMVEEQVRQLLGNSFGLYRGIHGEQAGTVLDGGPVALKTLSSWTTDIDQALRFRTSEGVPLGGEDWIIVQATFTPEDVAFAGVTLPDYWPDPNVLGVLNREAEVVIMNERGGLDPDEFRLAYKTRRQRGAAYPGNLGFEEMWKFQNIATPEEQQLMDNLLDWEEWEQAWQLLQDVTGVELHGLKTGGR